MPTPPACRGVRIASPELDQTPAGLTLDERSKCFPQQSRPLSQPGIFLRLGDQIIVKSYGGAHWAAPFRAPDIASNDAKFNAGRRSVDERLYHVALTEHEGVGDVLQRGDVGVGLAGADDLREAPVEHRIFRLRLLMDDATVDGELRAAA